MSGKTGAHVLLTGATGFIGKVILEELLRRRDELNLARIDVLIRPKKGVEPADRLAKVLESPCFRELPPGWQGLVHPVTGDITEPGLGLEPVVAGQVTATLTHLIHCAASVDFDLPLAEAAGYNITGALGALAVAKRSPNLQAFVDVSTAYVWPHAGGLRAFPETLVDIPLDAAATYESIRAGRFDEKALLATTGHPNTYTFTKCLAERLLAERQEGVPLVILRPSIVAACWEYPFPGWVDSKAAFIGFCALFTLGYLRVLGIDPEARLNLVPCDIVAAHAIRAAFDPTVARRDTPAIRYAAASVEQSEHIRAMSVLGTSYYSLYPARGNPVFSYVGPLTPEFHLREWLEHRLPSTARWLAAALTGQKKLAYQARKLLDVQLYLNRGFRYFMSRTFDFQASWPIDRPGFAPEPYLRTVYQGVNEFLMGVDARAVAIGGAEAKGLPADAGWSRRGPGNGLHRTFGYGLRKVFRRACRVVSVDLASFEAALADVGPDERVVVVASHRSYLDFLVLPYLFFSKPQLGIAMPHIAATNSFAKLPLVGRLLKGAQAFYLQRGLGQEDTGLTRQVRDLLADGRVLKFFIEGTRSRSRRFLQPRRGLLRAIQGSGHPVRILPVAVSYDRVPEEAAILAELRGDTKAKEKVGAITDWLRRALRGDIRLGRIHVACGAPLPLTADTDVPELAQRIMAELQTGTSISTFHLEAVLTHHDGRGWTLADLRACLASRGARVLDGLPLAEAAALDPLLVRCLEQQLLPWFYADLLAWLPDHPVVRHHVAHHGPAAIGVDGTVPDAPLQQLLQALVAPICRDYQVVAQYLAGRLGQTGPWRARDLQAALPGVFAPDVTAVLDDLTVRRILTKQDDGFVWGPEAVEIQVYAPACAWPVGGAGAMPVVEAAAVAEAASARGAL